MRTVEQIEKELISAEDALAKRRSALAEAERAVAEGRELREAALAANEGRAAETAREAGEAAAALVEESTIAVSGLEKRLAALRRERQEAALATAETIQPDLDKDLVAKNEAYREGGDFREAFCARLAVYSLGSELSTIHRERGDMASARRCARSWSGPLTPDERRMVHPRPTIDDSRWRRLLEIARGADVEVARTS